jgi:uncharacterized phage protein (TIGR02218 family)
MSVDNTEVTGQLQDQIVFQITADDLAAGLFNNAAVSLFFLDWNAPTSPVNLRTGFLGQMTYDSSNVYTTELRGLTQLLSQNIVQTYTVNCNVVKFGDARCTINVPAISITATATTVTNRKVFVVTGITTQRVGLFDTGNLVGLTGANTGYSRQIRDDDTDATHGKITLYEEFPATVAPGDTFTMSPGCDRSFGMCQNDYDNVLNFRGYGIFIPGLDAIMKGPAGLASA